MAELEIIGTPISNYVRTIRMLCEEKGLPKLTILSGYLSRLSARPSFANTAPPRL